MILTIFDKFSKFAAAYTLSDRNSISIIKALKNYISLHGIPKKLTVDSATEFTSLLFKDFCKQYDIILHHTAIHQSTGNSPVERLHSTLTEIYRIVHEKLKGRDHEEILSETIITYNNSIHSVTKLTPYEAFYGRSYQFSKENHSNVHEYLEKLHEFQLKFYPEIKARLQEKVEQNIEKLNKNREDPASFNEGTIIYKKENRRSKLAKRFTKDRVKENKHVTILTTNNKKFHKSKIKKKRLFQVSTAVNNCDNTKDGSPRPDK
jgi:hypothetical protein